MTTIIDLARRIGQDIRTLGYDSGRRELPLTNSATGRFFIQRTGNRVEVYARELITTGTGDFATIPAGFRPTHYPLYGLIGRTGGRQFATFDIYGAYVIGQGTSHTIGCYLFASWTTRDPIPTTLPGTPA